MPPKPNQAAQQKAAADANAKADANAAGTDGEEEPEVPQSGYGKFEYIN